MWIISIHCGGPSKSGKKPDVMRVEFLILTLGLELSCLTIVLQCPHDLIFEVRHCDYRYLFLTVDMTSVLFPFPAMPKEGRKLVTKEQYQ